MNKQKIISVILWLLLPVMVFSQSSNWNSAINLNVSANSSDRIDLYTDADGNHIIVQKSNQLVYYLFSPSGTLIRSSVRDNNVNESPRLSRIVGREGNLYIIYKEGNKIKTQKSTNGGASWSTTAVNEITMVNNTSNGIDAWTDANGVHLVFSEDDPNATYKTWYQRNDGVGSDWVEQKDVTDLSGDAGGFPGVTTSANRVHVVFTDNDFIYPGDGYGIPKSRDRLNSSWQVSQTVIEDYYIAYASIIANSTKLHVFYYRVNVPYHILKYQNRDINGSWSSNEIVLESYANAFEPLDLVVTANDKVHIFYNSLNSPKGRYNVWNNGWGNAYGITTSYLVYSPKIAANGNDVYVIWNTGSTLMLRQRDFAPLAPYQLNWQVTQDNHPKIFWDYREADIDHFTVERAFGNQAPLNWQFLTNTSDPYYVDIDITISKGGSGPNYVNYRVKSVDLSQNESQFSDPLQIEYMTSFGSESRKEIDFTVQILPTEPVLYSNYPNPFNPTTTIRFALPHDQQVTLTVYSVTGERVAVLVNGYLEKGFHRVEWNGTNRWGVPVSSGIYMYVLRAGATRLVGKMLLAK